MDARLDGKNALVSGGTRGIGRATTLALARAGANVAVCYRENSQAADDLGRELKDLGAFHRIVRADLADPDAVRRLAAECKDAFGSLDVLVNNAGIDAVAPVEEIDDGVWNRVLEANLASVHRTIRTMLPLLSRGSSIVNIGAAIAFRGLPGRAHYGAAKAGVFGLTRALAKELGPRRIRVNMIAPGVIATEPDAGLPPPIRERIESATALGRLGLPEDVADVVVFLAGNLASYVTGEALTVDGGI